MKICSVNLDRETTFLKLVTFHAISKVSDGNPFLDFVRLWWKDSNGIFPAFTKM